MTFVIIVAAMACASRAPVDVLLAERNLDGVMRLVGRYGFGHACPCDGLILTAAHVAHPIYTKGPAYKNEPIEHAWSDSRGGWGFVSSRYLQLGRDLGFVHPRSGTPAYYTHAMLAPQVGDTVYWSEYDFSCAEKILAPITREGAVVRLVAGHIVVDHMPVAGASGSCVFNESGEVVAIVAWGHRLGVAIMVSVYGPWWPGSLPE